MDDTNSLPNDLTQCHQLLFAAHKQSVELERQAAEATQQAAQAKRHSTQAERRVAESEQQVAELSRVLDETAASYQELQQQHTATLEELAWYKRWTFGRRRERFTEGDGQRHLFELDTPLTNESLESITSGPEVTGFRLLPDSKTRIR